MMTLDVTGMDCMGCVKAVEKAVKRVDPAAAVLIDLPTGRVTIEGANAERASFETAITRAGYGLKDVA
jgi:copper chaperone